MEDLRCQVIPEIFNGINNQPMMDYIHFLKNDNCQGEGQENTAFHLDNCDILFLSFSHVLLSALNTVLTLIKFIIKTFSVK